VPFFAFVADAEWAELLAYRAGLKLAKEQRVLQVALETDSLGMASKLQKEDRDRSVYGSVDEIKGLLLSFDKSIVRAVRRTGNGAAHVLAREGCVNKVDRR
jgi:ribonuclease HI